MISHELLVYFCIAIYGTLGLANVIMGAAHAKKEYETHYGFPHALFGLLVLAVTVWMYVA